MIEPADFWMLLALLLIIAVGIIVYLADKAEDYDAASTRRMK